MGQNWDVIIIGSGIGRLSAAQFLRKGGIKTLVLKRSPGLNEVEAGLQLAPKAQAALRALDVWDELAPRAWILKQVQLLSTRSGELALMDAKSEGLVAMCLRIVKSPLKLSRFVVHMKTYRIKLSETKINLFNLVTTVSYMSLIPAFSYTEIGSKSA